MLSPCLFPSRAMEKEKQTLTKKKRGGCRKGGRELFSSFRVRKGEILSKAREEKGKKKKGKEEKEETHYILCLFGVRKKNTQKKKKKKKEGEAKLHAFFMLKLGI